MSNADPTARFSGDDREVLEIVAQLNDALGGTGGAETFDARALDRDQLCEQYRRIRPWLQRFLPFIAQIPVIGRTLSTALTLLMGIADNLCGVN